MKNILIFLNTEYHVETALSVYESVKIANYKPFILIDYIEENKNYDFKILDFFKEKNIQYLTPDSFDEISDKEFFHKMILITATQNNRSLSDPEKLPPINYNHRMEKLKDRAILIYHRADYSDYIKYSSNFFNNPKSISVSQFSQKYGLDYIYQVENPIANIKQNFDENILKFLIIGRFNLKNRHLDLLHNLPKIDEQLGKKIKIDFIGQQPNLELPITSFLNEQNFKNIEYEFHFNLNQIDFYDKIYNSDYILNLVINNYYALDRFTSNINHIVAFSKPNITPLFLNLVYNIPGLNYVKNFDEIFMKAINLTKEDYEKMVLNFDVAKKNMRNHNTELLKSLIN